MQQASSFGDLLRRRRVRAGLTQHDLAERAGLSVRGISDLERAVNLRPRHETVCRLEAALELRSAERTQFQAAALEAALRTTRPSLGPESEQVEAAQSPLIGRAEAVSAVEEQLGGSGRRVLVVAGEPGIGKSRLLHESARQAAALQFNVIQGGCQRRSGGDPYAPLPQALMTWIDRQPKAQLLPLLREARWLFRFLPELSGLGLYPTDFPLTSPDQERRLMFRDVSRLLTDAAGAAGTLLVLDDLQWASADLFDLLSYVLSCVATLRVLGGYRDTETLPQHPLSTWLDDVARERQLMHLQLRPLTDREAGLLLESLLPAENGERDVLQDRIVQRAGGVPYFLVSYAEGVRAGIVDPQAEVPWDLAQSIRQRVASLPDEAQTAVAAAAVIGRSVSLDLLASTLHTSYDEVLAALEAARDGGLLLEDCAGSYRFRHDLVRDVVEGDLSAGRRALLHQQLAGALEQAGPTCQSPKS